MEKDKHESCLQSQSGHKKKEYMKFSVNQKRSWGKAVVKEQVLCKIPRVGRSCKYTAKENCTFRIKFQNFKEILRKYQNWLPSQNIQTL